MFYFKACPKCSGDMCDTRDSYGAYCQCMQCGKVVYPATEPYNLFTAPVPVPVVASAIPHKKSRRAA